MCFRVHVGTLLPAHTIYLLYWCAGWFWTKIKHVNRNTQRIMTVAVWWKYNILKRKSFATESNLFYFYNNNNKHDLIFTAS